MTWIIRCWFVRGAGRESEGPGPFIVVTPPLFRLDALQSSRLRIVRTRGVS
ncbi:fimbria/pilus periplasmic chaperone [Escherichia coli]|uniref:fimbria/pilus periplasmic chaperone n=1 Tax=Escherichia coli TaxID=562 RepID=UPI0034608B59